MMIAQPSTSEFLRYFQIVIVLFVSLSLHVIGMLNQQEVGSSTTAGNASEADAGYNPALAQEWAHMSWQLHVIPNDSSNGFTACLEV